MIPLSEVRSNRRWRRVWPRKWADRTKLDSVNVDLSKPESRKFRNDFWCKRCGGAVWPTLRAHDKFARGDLNAHFLSVWICASCGLQQFDPVRKFPLARQVA